MSKRIISSGFRPSERNVSAESISTISGTVINFGRSVALRLAIVTGVCSLLTIPGHAYTVVETSTSAPAGLEQTFIAATSAQFQETVVTNPFFPNTYNILLEGLNPNYQPPVSPSQLLQEIDQMGQYEATVDSETYVAGFGDGESYNQFATVGLLVATTGGFEANCSTGAANVGGIFTLIHTTSDTFDSATCQDVVNTIANAVYTLHLATPTVVPGNWQ